MTGPGLDEIASRYETALPDFESFNITPPIKLFRSILARPVATRTTTTETAINNFTEAEMEKFGSRWRVGYRRGIYYVSVAAGPDLSGSGPGPQIRHANYTSPRTGRGFDVTHVLQSACSHGSDGCRIACGNQLAGDPDFGRVKMCQITYQCGSHAIQSVTMSEGRSVTLACAP